MHWHPADMQNKHLLFVDQAAGLAAKSGMRMRHGCVIVHRNKIVGSGFNYRFEKNGKHSVHAEESALLSLSQKVSRLKHLKVYVARVGAQGLSPSYPCKHCAKLLLMRPNICKVFYS